MVKLKPQAGSRIVEHYEKLIIEKDGLLKLQQDLINRMIEERKKIIKPSLN